MSLFDSRRYFVTGNCAVDLGRSFSQKSLCASPWVLPFIIKRKSADKPRVAHVTLSGLTMYGLRKAAVPSV